MGFEHTERTWAEVDLGAIVDNYRLAARLAPKAVVMPVVKADAYGHGMLPVAAALEKAGAARFAVATAGEALALRQSGCRAAILVLGAVPPGCVAALSAAGIAVCVPGEAVARMYSGQLGAGATLAVHIKVDTGMSRLGVTPAGLAGLVACVGALPGLRLEGVFTHFAASEDAGQDAFSAGQQEAFLACAGEMSGVLRHCANSGGILRGRGVACELVRPGILLYGYAPGPDAADATLRPALRWKARIADVRRVEQGAAVSYGLTWRAEQPAVIATVCAGYADGVPRVASGRLRMLVHGRPARQVGRVCMDMCMLDVTDIENVQPGDVATLIGDGLTADDMAAAAGTISYEVLCGISARVPRFYMGAGE